MPISNRHEGVNAVAMVFSEDRIRNGCKKLAKARGTSTQGRLDSFFKVIPGSNTSNKRKVCIL